MDISIACALDAAGLADRREEWAALRRFRTGERRTASTLTTTWRRDAGVQAQLECLVAAERKCCPFLGLELTADDTAVILVTSFPQGLSPIDWEW
jgi:hypothetical protein